MSAKKFSQYRPILVDLASSGLDMASTPVADEDSVLIGIPAARLLCCNDPAFYHGLVDGFKYLAGVGRALAGTDQTPVLSEPGGSRRPVYHALVLHLHLAAFNLHYEGMPGGVWSACEDRLPMAVDSARQVEQYGDVRPPSEQIDLVLWQSLCLLEQAEALGRDVDVELIDAVVHQAITPDGNAASYGGPAALYPRDAGDPLDPWMYRELCGLHALANLALQRRNKNWARRVEQIAVYHLSHIQSAHRATEPWAIFAFAWPQGTESYTEQQLHDLMVLAEARRSNGDQPMRGAVSRYLGRGVVAAMLLADAAHAMKAFEVQGLG